MKKLLLLAFIVVSCEAMAQDAQCVRERAAMVENIRAYARPEAGVLGPQGISDRVPRRDEPGLSRLAIRVRFG